MRSLCMGQIEEGVMFPFPKLAPEQQETLREVCNSLQDFLASKEEDFRKWDRQGELPAEFIEQLKEFGLFGLIIPEEQGGLGFGSAAYSRALQELAKYDGSVAVTVGAHSSIGMRGLLLVGNDEQKQRYL